MSTSVMGSSSVDTSSMETSSNTAPALEASPLSPVQRSREVWCPERAAEAIATIRIEAKGKLDHERLGRAFDRLRERHELLSMRVLRIPEVEQAVQVVDDGETDGDENGRARLRVTPLADGSGSLIALELPWLLTDRKTLEELATELIEAYLYDETRGEDVLQFLDVASWQEDLLESEEAEDARRFWSNVPREERRPLFPEGFGLETSPADPASFEVTLERSLDPPQVGAIEAWAADRELSVGDVLRTAFSCLLHRRAGAPVPVALRIDGRDAPELVGVVGPLDRWVPVPSKPPEDADQESFSDCTRRLAAEAADVRRWTDAHDGKGQTGKPLGPFAAGFSAAPPPAGIVSAHIHMPEISFAFSGLDRGPLPARLVLETEIADGFIWLTWVAAPGTLEAKELENLANGFEALLDSAVANNPTLDALALAGSDTDPLSEASAPSEPALRGISECFAARVIENPETVALVDEHRSFSRRDLDRAANQIATAIQAAGVSPGARVGIALPRSGSVIAAYLACWRAGTAFVPLDLDLPALALTTRIREGELQAVIFEAVSALTLPEEVRSVAIDVSQLLSGIEQQTDQPADLPQVSWAPTDLAYGIFTSGSTGQPKLVGVEHGALASYVAAIENRLDLDAGLAFATVSSFASDLGHTAIFPALASGGILQVIGSDRAMDPERLAERFRAAPADVLKIVPSHLTALLSGRDAADILPKHTLVLGGERLESALVEQVRALAPELRIVNHYGPTESTVGVLTHEIASGPSGGNELSGPPLGTPLPGVVIEVVDGAGQVVPRGVPGELWIGGAQLAQGYVGREDLTDERFVQPERGDGKARRYRTGDRAWMDAEGRIHFGGRVDDQLKIRGLRVEPGEIERTLAEHPEVKGVAVCAFGERLVGYAVGDAAPKSLISWLAERLPAAMVPERIVALERLPLTANGKLDRRALPEPEPMEDSGPYVEPEGDNEQRLAAIFGDILGLERVSSTASFFKLGGHSLLATRAVSRIREAFEVELPLTVLFEESTVRGLAARLAASAPTDAESALPPLERAGREGPLPLSFAQRRMWLLDRLETEGRTAYTIPMAARLQGRLDRSALSDSIDELVRRHETLRTVFRAGGDGEPIQVIQPADVAGRVPIERIDLSAEPEEAREAAIGRALATRALAPFDLAAGPLLRVTLVELGPEEHLLVAVCHHVVFDAWSRGVMLAELTTLYRAFAQGQPSPLTRLDVQYADFAVWQRDWLSGERRTAELDYWKKTLSGAPGLLQLPADRPRPSRPTHRGERIRARVSKTTSSKLAELANASGATPFMVLLAAFDVLLSRLTGRMDIVVGSPIANRRHPELERLIGFFTNTVVLRTDLSGTPTFRGLLDRVRSTALEAYAHQDLPFEELVEVLPVTRDFSANPIFQVLFTLRNTPRDPVTFHGLTFEPVDAEAPTAKLDLTVLFEETEEGLFGSFEYATDLFRRETVEGWRDAYVNLLDAICEDPDACIDDLPLGLPLSLRPDPHQANEDSKTQTESIDETLADRFVAMASKFPEAPAIGMDGEFMSFGELDQHSNRVARVLIERGIQPEDRIGLAVERGTLEWVAMLAAWKVGAAYIPLDPSFPAERLGWMIRSSDVRWVMTAGPRAASALPDHVRKIYLEDSTVFKTSSEPLNSGNKFGANLAYVLYTSGSTGRPKGVGVSHKSALFFLDAMTTCLGWSIDTHLLAVTTLSFDIALLERWGPLLLGGISEVASLEEATDGVALARRLDASGATEFQGTPATWRLLHDAGWVGDPSLMALVGGEALPVELASWLAERSCDVWNLYGPTETTVWSTAQRFDPSKERNPTGIVELGEPLGTTRLAVLDPQGRPVPVGVWGELAIGGPGVARGYERRAAETAQRFVPDPRAPSPGERIYRTGDICRLRRDGGLEYGGRRDGQVKVRGYRIEVGEIEAQLNALLSVATSAVVVDDEILVAFVTSSSAQTSSDEAASKLDSQTIRGELAATLPGYMIPQYIQEIAAMPLTLNGKIDRRTLVEEARSRDQEPLEYIPPSSETEEVLASIFAEVLNLEQVSTEAGFFDIGGHSLLATRVVVQIRERLGVEVPLRTLFEASTVAALAARIEAGEALSSGSVLVPIATGDRPERIPLSHAQERLWFIDQLKPGDASYSIPLALRLVGPLDVDALAASLRSIVARHEVLRTTFPSVEGKPEQRIHAEDSDLARAAATFDEIDLGGIDRAEQEAAVRERVLTTAREPFDLAQGPLLNTKLLYLAPREHVIVLVAHHIISDGWSAGVLAQELTTLYAAFRAGAPSPLEPLEVQYADWAIHERATVDEEAVRQELEHWKGKLAGAPQQLLAPDNDGESRAAAVSCSVDGATVDRLESLARTNEASLFMVCLAAFQLLLGREGEKDDVVVGTDVAHRTHGATEKLIGFFVNVLPLRTRLARSSFTELIAQVRETCLEAFEYQDVPFARIAGALGERRDDGRSPLVQVLFVFQNLPPVRLQLGDLEVQVVQAAEPTTKFDITFFFSRTESGLSGTWRYDTGRFSSERIERLARRFEKLLTTLVTTPDVAIDEIDLRTEAEREAERSRSSRRTSSRRSRLRRASARPVAAVAAAPIRTGAPIEGMTGYPSGPWCVEATGPDADLIAWARSEREAVNEAIKEHGVVLFRGGPLHEEAAFEALGRALVDELYGEYGDLPRASVSGKVYGSTPYPPDRSILFHNESSHLSSWPTRILFGCAIPAETRGETPLADGRVVLERLPDDVRERFETRGLRYSRTFTKGLDVRWQDFFLTDSREEVERRCAETGTEIEWDEDGTLRISNRRQAIFPHPDHGWPVWFNQIALHHPRYLDDGVREALLSKYGVERLPRNLTFGDGSIIEDSDLAAVDRAYDEALVQFPWRQGDVLFVDNERVSHARNPFTGKRKIIVGMGRMRTPEGDIQNRD